MLAHTRLSEESEDLYTVATASQGTQTEGSSSIEEPNRKVGTTTHTHTYILSLSPPYLPTPTLIDFVIKNSCTWGGGGRSIRKEIESSTTRASDTSRARARSITMKSLAGVGGGVAAATFSPAHRLSPSLYTYAPNVWL